MKNKKMAAILGVILCCYMFFGVQLEAGKPENAAKTEAARQEVVKQEEGKPVSEKSQAAQSEETARPEEATKADGAVKPEAGEVKEAGKDASDEDFYFEKKSLTYINGELAGPEKKLEVWMKGDRIRFESEDKKDVFALILMDKGKSYELDKVQKTYKETSYDFNKMKEASERSMVVSKRTGEKKKIKDWNCYEVFLDTTIQGTKMKATCWLSEDIKVSTKAMQKMAKFSQMKMMEELVKYPGYPVQLTMDSVLQGKQVRVVSTLVKISKSPIKSIFFQIPFEYTKITETQTQTQPQ